MRRFSFQHSLIRDDRTPAVGLVVTACHEDGEPPSRDCPGSGEGIEIEAATDSDGEDYLDRLTDSERIELLDAAWAEHVAWRESGCKGMHTASRGGHLVV